MSGGGRAHQPAKFCPAGHEYTPENTDVYTRRNRPGSFKQCKTCKAARRIAARSRRLHCPFCKKETHPRSGPVIPGVPRALLADGTCDLCYRAYLNGGIKKHRGNKGSDEAEARRIATAREGLEAYFRDRRNRGINPNGNAELDAAFEEDTGWQKKQRLTAANTRAGKRRAREAMESKEFDRYLDRDGGVCLHCGTTEGLIPQHRKNRGMGGSKVSNIPSNVIVLCSELNGQIESHAAWAERAKEFGWKVGAGEDPATTPVFDYSANRWYLLGDDFSRTEVPAPWGFEAAEA
jgi:hypothetical protein